jgi:hypothetical protein
MAAPIPQCLLAWFGYSIGKWEGDWFATDTRGFNDKSWVDDSGRPHTDALHTIERFRRRDFRHMDVEITIDDPQAYTKTLIVSTAIRISRRYRIHRECVREREICPSCGRQIAASGETLWPPKRSIMNSYLLRSKGYDRTGNHFPKRLYIIFRGA